MKLFFDTQNKFSSIIYWLSISYQWPFAIFPPTSLSRVRRTSVNSYKVNQNEFAPKQKPNELIRQSNIIK